MGTRVYVGHLSSYAREKDVERFFRSYGKIRDIMLKNGYGFVEFEDHRDADDAVYELDGKELCGEKVSVEHARGSRGGVGGGRSSFNDRGDRGFRGSRPRGNTTGRYGPPTRTDYRLIVENLSSRVSWQDLKDYMRQAGEVTYADAHKRHRNEGIIEFASLSDLRNAIEKLDGTEINGRKIKLVEDKPKRRSRSRSRSSSRSKSGSRSRSRSRSHSRDVSKDRKSKSGSVSPSRKRRQDSGSRSRSRSMDKDAARGGERNSAD